MPASFACPSYLAPSPARVGSLHHRRRAGRRDGQWLVLCMGGALEGANGVQQPCHVGIFFILFPSRDNRLASNICLGLSAGHYLMPHGPIGWATLLVFMSKHV